MTDASWKEARKLFEKYDVKKEGVLSKKRLLAALSNTGMVRECHCLPRPIGPRRRSLTVIPPRSRAPIRMMMILKSSLTSSTWTKTVFST